MKSKSLFSKPWIKHWRKYWSNLESKKKRKVGANYFLFIFFFQVLYFCFICGMGCNMYFHSQGQFNKSTNCYKVVLKSGRQAKITHTIVILLIFVYFILSKWQNKRSCFLPSGGFVLIIYKFPRRVFVWSSVSKQVCQQQQNRISQQRQLNLYVSLSSVTKTLVRWDHFILKKEKII